MVESSRRHRPNRAMPYHGVLDWQQAGAFPCDRDRAGEGDSCNSHADSYDRFGEVTGVVRGLALVTEKRRESERVRVTDDNADWIRRRKKRSPSSHSRAALPVGSWNRRALAWYAGR